MVARPFGSICSLLFVWLFALAAGPARHLAATPVVARSAMELALRDLADAPPLASRVLSARVGSSRPVERGTVPWQLTTFVSPPEQRAPFFAPEARATLDTQAVAHAARPRWRAYDAIAPPAPSRTAR